VDQWLESRIHDEEVQILLLASSLPGNKSGQLVHTLVTKQYMVCVILCQPKGSDAV